MARFINVRCFTVFAAIYGFCFGLFPLYTVSQVTTIEKHFDLPSQRSGTIVSGSEIGFIVSAILIGYFSNYFHRPRILCYCTILICVGALLANIPFYIDISTGRATNPAYLWQENTTCGSSSTRNCTDDISIVEQDVSGAFWYFLMATILYGAGSCGLWTIGVSYIDDNADRKLAYFYVGAVICVRFLAPVGGMMLGAGVAPVPVHIEDNGLSPEDVGWVGAWWIGYYVIFILVLLSSIPFWFYPKVLSEFPEHQSDSVYTVSGKYIADDGASAVTEGTVSSTAKLASSQSLKQDDRTVKSLIKGFPHAVWRLVKNPIYMCGSLATSLDFSISLGFGVFVPKYFEVYFHTTAAVANFITGIALAFSACIGSGLGGFLMSRIRWPLSKMVLVATIANMGICVLYVPMILLRCPGAAMTGVTSASSVSLDAECNAGCDCPDNLYNPVCDRTQVFYSPCHAGCLQRFDNGTFSDCACSNSSALKPGLCEEECTPELLTYAALLFIVVMCLSAAEIPAYMLNIRSVAEQDKGLALAILNVFTSIFAFPMPILFGWMVDGACLVLQPFACSDGAACALYDNDLLKYRLHLLAAGLKVIPTILYVIAWYLARNEVFPGDENMITLDASLPANSRDSVAT